MGSTCSKQRTPFRRIGLFSQQQKYILSIQNNESIRHKRRNYLEDLGILREVYEDTDKWDKFKEYLKSQIEGEDKHDAGMSMERYSIWLELFIKLDSAISRGRISTLLEEMEEHLDHVTGLKCIESEMRRIVQTNMRAVREGIMEPDSSVCDVIFYKVVEQLQEHLKTYQSNVKGT